MISAFLILPLVLVGVWWYHHHLYLEIHLREVNQKIINQQQIWENEKNHLQMRITMLEEELTKKNLLLRETELKSEHLATILEEKEKHLLEINQQEVQMTNQFRNISHNLLQQQGELFLREQLKNFDQLLKPLEYQLENFDKSIRETNKLTLESKASLGEHVNLLLQQTRDMGNKADNLANVLRYDKKAQGNWGELKLKNLLELIGLVENIDYTTQQSLKNDQGDQCFLDFVIQLPHHRQLIIDAKVSLVNYENYRNTTKEQEKNEFLKKYCEDLRRHMEELGAKKYHELYGANSLDFVFMFLPLEGAYLEAINYDKNLLSISFRNKVALVTGSSLLPVLRLLEYLWGIEKQNKNIDEIIKLVVRLHEKILKFVESLQHIDLGLDNAHKAYVNAINYLSNGNGNILKTISDIQSLAGKKKTMMTIDIDL
jgi:DNA recombination protein RmuC